MSQRTLGPRLLAHPLCALIPLALGLVALAACQPQPGPQVPPVEGIGPVVAIPTPVQTSITDYREAKFQIQKQEGIVYALGNVESPGGVPGLKALRLTLTTPTGHDARDKPAVVFIDGAGADALASFLTARGFVCAIAETRSPADRPPQPATSAVTDARAALRWLHAHARELGVSETRIAIAGFGEAGSVAQATAQSDPESLVKDAPKGFDQEPLHPFNSPDASAFVRAGLNIGGPALSVDAPPATGIAIQSFSGSADTVAQPILDFLLKTMVTDKTYYYQLAVQPAPNGSVTRSPGGGFYTAGQKVTLSATPDPGYHFVEWTGATNDYRPRTDLTIGRMDTVKPRFAANEPQAFTDLTVHVQGGGRVELVPPGGHYVKNSWIRLYKLPQAGWKHQVVPPSITAGLDYLDLYMDRNSDISVIFEKTGTAQRTLSINATSGGTVTLDPPGGTYPEGTTVTVTAHPAAGKRLGWWAGDTRQTDPTIWVVMSTDKHIEAGFE